MRLFLIAVVFLITEAYAQSRDCPLPEELVKCQVDWFAKVRVTGIKRLKRDQHSVFLYKFKVIDGYKGLNKSQVFEAVSYPSEEGGLELKTYHAYLLAGNATKNPGSKYAFDYCSQLKRGQPEDLDVQYMPKKLQVKLRDDILSCKSTTTPSVSTEPVKPDLKPHVDRSKIEELLVKIVNLLKAIKKKLD